MKAFFLGSVVAIVFLGFAGCATKMVPTNINGYDVYMSAYTSLVEK